MPKTFTCVGETLVVSLQTIYLRTRSGPWAAFALPFRRGLSKLSKHHHCPTAHTSIVHHTVVKGAAMQGARMSGGLISAILHISNWR